MWIHSKMRIKKLRDDKKAEEIVTFLTGPNTFDQNWTPEEKNIVKKAVLSSLNEDMHQYWYIEDKGKVIAAAGVSRNKYDSGGFEMDSDYIAVHPKYRRLGLATKLLNKIETYVKSNNGRYIHVLSCDINSYIPLAAFMSETATNR